MLGAKLATIQVPFLFKHTVDGLSGETAAALAGDPFAAAAMTPTMLMLAYGVNDCEARLGFIELHRVRRAMLSLVPGGRRRVDADDGVEIVDDASEP